MQQANKGNFGEQQNELNPKIPKRQFGMLGSNLTVERNRDDRSRRDSREDDRSHHRDRNSLIHQESLPKRSNENALTRSSVSSPARENAGRHRSRSDSRSRRRRSRTPSPHRSKRSRREPSPDRRHRDDERHERSRRSQSRHIEDNERRESEPRLQRSERPDYDEKPARHRESSRERRHASSSAEASAEIVPITKYKRMLSCWDVPPPGFSHLTAEQVKATGLFPPPWAVVGKTHHQGIVDPTRIAMLVLKYPLQPNREDRDCQLQNLLVDASLSNADYSQFSRVLFVQNIAVSRDFSIADIENVLNEKLASAGLLGDSQTAFVHSHYAPGSNFCFLETGTIQQMSFLVRHSGSIAFKGIPLSIKKGSQFLCYFPNPLLSVSIPEMEGAEDPNSNCLLIVGNIPKYLYGEELEELFACFGAIRSVKLAHLSSGGTHSKGYAIVRYADAESADVALEGLNMLRIGSNRLVAAVGSVAIREPCNIPGIAPPSEEGIVTCFISNIIEIINAASQEDFIFEDNHNALIESIHNECASYGTIVDVVAPRSDEDDLYGRYSGRIFVIFERAVDALNAAEALGGLFFQEDKQISVSFVPVDKFYSQVL